MTDTPLLPLLRNLVNRLVDFKVIHPEYIPEEGSILLTTNHLSRLDTPFLLSITDRMDLVAIVAKKYQQRPIFRWILEKIGTMVWMDRENTDFSAIREALAYLREGMIVGIAPEGTRSRDSKGLLEAKQGAALMAARAGVPIVPVGIVGSENVSRELLRLRRPPVTITVGKPYTLPAFDRKDRQAWLSNYTDEIMCRIAALLPPNYRGFYADHPRLKELLAGKS
ncbi:MAG: lysophospholipid acyltransferase family protein [Chloroflexota bacterium]|nr:lysophospholipid acyltransferase family protein [Chloroflexota bacterium]